MKSSLFNGSVGGVCMGKCFRTIYFDAETYIEAEKQNIDFNAICNEAIKMVLNKEENKGTTKEATGNVLSFEAQKSKDIDLLKRLNTTITPTGKQKFLRVFVAFCQKYNLSQNEANKLL